jgi:hypothetical protein
MNMSSAEMSMPVFGLLCVMMVGLLFVAAVVGTVVMIATLADRRVWDGLAKAFAVALPLLGVAAVLLFFIGFSATTSRKSATIVYPDSSVPIATPSGASVEVLEPMSYSPVLPSHGDLVPSDTVAITTNRNDLRPAEAQPATNELPPLKATGDLIISKRPDWASLERAKTPRQDGEITIVVLPSALFATEQEAEASLQPQIMSLVESDFLKVVRKRSMRPRELKSITGMADSAVTARYVEMETRDLGAVTAPMYRVWMKLELSPQTRAQFLDVYRTQVTESRILVVSALLLGLLAIPMAIVASSAATRASRGRGQRFWRLAAGTAVLLLWGAGLFLMQRHFVFFE